MDAIFGDTLEGDWIAGDDCDSEVFEEGISSSALSSFSSVGETSDESTSRIFFGDKLEGEGFAGDGGDNEDTVVEESLAFSASCSFSKVGVSSDE